MRIVTDCRVTPGTVYMTATQGHWPAAEGEQCVVDPPCDVHSRAVPDAS